MGVRVHFTTTTRYLTSNSICNLMVWEISLLFNASFCMHSWWLHIISQSTNHTKNSCSQSDMNTTFGPSRMLNTIFLTRKRRSERIAEVIQHSIFKEAFVQSHELGNESLQVVDCLLTGLQSVLIKRSCLCHFGLQLSITVRHQLLQQTLQCTSISHADHTLHNPPPSTQTV